MIGGRATIRAFVAVELDAAARRRIAEWVDRTRREGEGVRWVAARSWHITMRFLGEIDPGTVPELLSALRVALEEVPPFATRWERLAPFPPGRRPSVMALHPTSGTDLSILAGIVERALEGVGFERERRRFHAHLTLGRFRGRGAGGAAGESRASEPIVVPVEELTLFESELRPAGALHHPLGRLPLGGSWPHRGASRTTS